jgi:hypothetical protein
MTHSTAASSCFGNIAASGGSAALGAWPINALRRRMSLYAVTPGPSRREREVADLRGHAASIRESGRRRADDLFAAADRHEDPRV